MEITNSYVIGEAENTTSYTRFDYIVSRLG